MSVAIIVLAFLRITTAEEPRWWIALKYPQIAFENTGKDAGLQYDYADENHDSFVFQEGKTLNDPTSPLRKVLQAYKKAKLHSGNGWLAWNDQYKGRKYKRGLSPCAKNAHSKGFLFFNADGGHLVTHSCPDYPKASFGLSNNCKNHGQHFLYLKLSRDGLLEFSNHLESLWAFKVENGFRDDEDGTLARIYPDLSSIAADSSNTLVGLTPLGKPVVDSKVQLAGRNSPSIRVITKPCWKKESIFEIIKRKIATENPILATTWTRAARKKKEPPTDGVYNVLRTRGMDPVTKWQNSNDHSKYFVEGSDDGKHAGIGDLNRAKTQHDRGGMYFIFKLGDLAESFRFRVMSYKTDTCVMERQISCTFAETERRLEDTPVGASRHRRSLTEDSQSFLSCFACESVPTTIKPPESSARVAAAAHSVAILLPMAIYHVM